MAFDLPVLVSGAYHRSGGGPAVSIFRAVHYNYVVLCCICYYNIDRFTVQIQRNFPTVAAAATVYYILRTVQV